MMRDVSRNSHVLNVSCSPNAEPVSKPFERIAQARAVSQRAGRRLFACKAIKRRRANRKLVKYMRRIALSFILNLSVVRVTTINSFNRDRRQNTSFSKSPVLHLPVVVVGHRNSWYAAADRVTCVNGQLLLLRQ